MVASVCAVIVAGGSGSRFGNPGGKQLVNVAGRPLLAWTLAAFDAAERVGHIVVVCPTGFEEEVRSQVLVPWPIATPLTFAPSGAERQDSTRSGMDAVPSGFDAVAIHDGARPLIRPETIDAAIDALMVGEGLDGVACGQPAVDTLKIVDGDGRFVETPPRSRYWAVQTPQIFWLKSLRRAYAWADATGFVGTDDASLVEGMGGTVRGFASPRDNLKVTYPEDLPLVEAVLKTCQLETGSF